MGHASMIGYAAGVMLAALLATAAMQFLLVTTRRPRWFLGWLAPAITVLLPLGLTQELPARLATATVILVRGRLAIIGLIRSSAAASLRSGGLAQRLETLSISAGRGMRNPRGHQGQMTSPQAVGRRRRAPADQAIRRTCWGALPTPGAGGGQAILGPRCLPAVAGRGPHCPLQG